MRAHDSTRSTGRRRRARALGPLLVSGLAVGALSCDGLCSLGEGEVISGPVGPTPTLQPRYVLTSLNGTTLPYTIAPGVLPRVRLLADTLVFSGAGTPPATNGTYVEVRTIGTQQQAGGPEVVSTTTSSPRRWTRGTTYALLLLEELVGVNTGPAQAQMYLGNVTAPDASVQVFGPLGSYQFTPR